MRNAAKALLVPAVLLAAMALIVFVAEGASAFRPFLNLEALALVLAGTALPLFVAYPSRRVFGAAAAAIVSDGPSERDAEVLECAAGHALTMGWIVFVLGVILILTGVHDFAELPRRFSNVLAAPFYGLVFSRLVLSPWARRLARFDRLSANG